MFKHAQQRAHAENLTVFNCGTTLNPRSGNENSLLLFEILLEKKEPTAATSSHIKFSIPETNQHFVQHYSLSDIAAVSILESHPAVLLKFLHSMYNAWYKCSL